MILYVKDHEDSTRNLLYLISTFSKVSGYKINFQKSVANLYATDEYTETEGIQYLLQNKKKYILASKNKIY